jgi:hypothetical protein
MVRGDGGKGKSTVGFVEGYGEVRGPHFGCGGGGGGCFGCGVAIGCFSRYGRGGLIEVRFVRGGRCTFEVAPFSTFVRYALRIRHVILRR